MNFKNSFYFIVVAGITRVCHSVMCVCDCSRAVDCVGGAGQCLDGLWFQNLVDRSGMNICKCVSTCFHEWMGHFWCSNNSVCPLQMGWNMGNAPRKGLWSYLNLFLLSLSDRVSDFTAFLSPGRDIDFFVLLDQIWTALRSESTLRVFISPAVSPNIRRASF